MLKNPVHLFRSDGKILHFPLFNARVFPRTDESLKKLNYCVAWRHMILNQLATEIPDPTNEVMNSWFYSDQHFDFRPEHPLVNGFRFAVINENSDNYKVINAYSKRLFRRAVDEVFEKHAGEIDVIYSIKKPVFYTDFQYLKDEILFSLIRSNMLNGRVGFKRVEVKLGIKKPEELHSYILRKSYLGNEKTLNLYAGKIAECLRDKDSLISVCSI